MNTDPLEATEAGIALLDCARGPECAVGAAARHAKVIGFAAKGSGLTVITKVPAIVTAGGRFKL